MASHPPTTSEPSPERKYLISITPPLLNSSNPWATTYDDLLSLYNSPHTGAVTIRTSLWKGFAHDPSTHQYAFFSSTLNHATSPSSSIPEHEGFAPRTSSSGTEKGTETSSLNTLGYSPIPFTDYCKILINMSQANLLTHRPAKPFILSVTGSVFDVAAAYTHLSELSHSPSTHRWKPSEEYGDLVLWMEINLSCPNILGTPPPAYDAGALGEYVRVIADARQLLSHSHSQSQGNSNSSSNLSPEVSEVHVGIKTPPYTHAGQFAMLLSVLEASTQFVGGCPISFITATNTLGSCLLLDEGNQPAVGDGEGIGGMAGDALHPLALGNVRTIRKMLDASPCEELRKIAIIGVGGVKDHKGFERMRSVGAAAVGVGTALGREGVGIFAKISQGSLDEFVNL